MIGYAKTSEVAVFFFEIVSFLSFNKLGKNAPRHALLGRMSGNTGIDFYNSSQMRFSGILLGECQGKNAVWVDS